MTRARRIAEPQGRIKRTSCARKMCDGQVTLAEAQHEIVTNWVRLGQPLLAPSSGPPAPSAPAQRAECTLSASYSWAYRQLRRLRPLQPARPDSDRDRRVRPFRHLAHRRVGIHRRLLQVRRAARRAAGTPARVGQASCSTTLERPTPGEPAHGLGLLAGSRDSQSSLQVLLVDVRKFAGEEELESFVSGSARSRRAMCSTRTAASPTVQYPTSPGELLHAGAWLRRRSTPNS